MKELEVIDNRLNSWKPVLRDVGPFGGGSVAVVDTMSPEELLPIVRDEQWLTEEDIAEFAGESVEFVREALKKERYEESTPSVRKVGLHVLGIIWIGDRFEFDEDCQQWTETRVPNWLSVRLRENLYERIIGGYRGEVQEIVDAEGLEPVARRMEIPPADLEGWLSGEKYPWGKAQVEKLVNELQIETVCAKGGRS